MLPKWLNPLTEATTVERLDVFEEVPDDADVVVACGVVACVWDIDEV